MGARETFVKKIASLRAGRSFRTFSKDIEEQTGVSLSHTTLRSYEMLDGKEPKFVTIDTLARYAHVSPSWFFIDENAKSDSKEYLYFLLREEGLDSKDIDIITNQLSTLIDYAKMKKKK